MAKAIMQFMLVITKQLRKFFFLGLFILQLIIKETNNLI